MTTNFITNQERLLSDVIKNILPSSERLFFLAGYFYFSGFFELYEQLKDKEVKILIGLEIEQALHNKLKEVYILDQQQKQTVSLQQIRANYFQSFVNLTNETSFCDSAEKIKAFRIFLAKIKNHTLEIRKTKLPNHAKLYIFEHKKEHSQNGELPGAVITGSSNLTLAGLKNQFEINVVSHEPSNYKEAKKLFNQLWDPQNSAPIVDKNNVSDFLEEVVEKIWIDRLFRPYLFYVRVIDEYLSINDRRIKLPSEITKNKYFNLQYQTDAINRSLDCLEKHSGVIIADVVGLGKSIIASAVAYNLGWQTIIIAPPHLRAQWEDYKRIFQLKGDIYNSGSIKKALKDYTAFVDKKLIIVDEAHKYRNALTGDYGDLHELCANNYVMLLTATPFNNKPQDLFSLIQLFQVPAKSTIRTVDNLSYEFRRLIREYKQIKKIDQEQKQKAEIKKIADKIRSLLFPVMIRRSRLDLEAISRYRQDLARQNIQFSTVCPPKLAEYSLGDLQAKYVATLEKIMGGENNRHGFIGARYKPVAYLINREKYKKEITAVFGDAILFRQAQKNLAKFMKRLLVHRFESSIYGFGRTLNSMLGSMQSVIAYYEKIGQVPIHKKKEIPDINFLLDTSNDEIDQEIKNLTLSQKIEQLQQDKGFWFIDKKELKKGFIKDLKNDVKLLLEIKHDWFAIADSGFDVGFDPKLEYFKTRLKNELRKYPDRKIAVFSSYADTIDYLYEKLKDEFKIFKYTSKQNSPKNKQIIRENFDAGLPQDQQKDDYQILIATDVISEGYNLHRAGTVFNYDIPYNPTRVIQRVGRINRVNKKVFDKLFIYNFFPSLTGEAETKVKHISTLKIDMIHALLGGDTQILTADEKLESFYQKEFAKAEQEQEELSWDSKYQDELDYLPAGIREQAKKIPKRSKIQRTAVKKAKGVLVFACKAGDYLFKLGSSDGERVLSAQTAIDLFKAHISEKPKPVSQNFDSIYQPLIANLFAGKENRQRDPGEQQAVDKIKFLLRNVPSQSAYLEDLLLVCFELENLPQVKQRLIRSFDLEKDKNYHEIVNRFKSEIRPDYLKNIIAKARDIEHGDESLILAEEMI